MQDKTGTIRYFCQNCGSCPQFNSMDGVHCTCGHKSSIHAVKPSPQFNQQFNQMPLPQQQFNQQMPPQQQFNQQMPPQQQQFNQQMPPQIKYDLDDKNIPRGNCFTCSCKRYVPRINQRGICSSCRHTGIQHVDATPKPVVIMQPPMPNPNMNNPIPNQNFNPNPSSIVNNQQHPGQNNNNNNNNCEKNDKCRECRLAGCTKDVNPGFDYCCRQHGIYGQKAGNCDLKGCDKTRLYDTKTSSYYDYCSKDHALKAKKKGNHGHGNHGHGNHRHHGHRGHGNHGHRGHGNHGY